MHFKIEQGTFEITGIKKVVVNTVVMDGEVKKRVGKTYVWELATVKNGVRWLKYEWGSLHTNATPDELRALILDGCSQVHMHRSIIEAVEADYVRVWFSGDTCNIEVNQTRQQEIRKAVKRRIVGLIRDAEHHINKATMKVDHARELEVALGRM